MDLSQRLRRFGWMWSLGPLTRSLLSFLTLAVLMGALVAFSLAGTFVLLGRTWRDMGLTMYYAPSSTVSCIVSTPGLTPPTTSRP